MAWEPACLKDDLATEVSWKSFRRRVRHPRVDERAPATLGVPTAILALAHTFSLRVLVWRPALWNNQFGF